MTSRYAAAHLNTKGPGDSRPTALQIVKDNGLEGQLVGKVAFITGCSSGIGIETARALAATGATVFCTARDMEKGKSALADFLEPGRVELLKLDLSSFDSVRACAKEFLEKSKTLNILVNNAGVMTCPESRTADGFETQFGTNHLAHFLLFNLLKPVLLASSTPDFNSRVVSVSSTEHRYVKGINFENFNLEGIYDPRTAYGQSKLANIYMANEIERLYGGKGLHAFSLHPGGISSGLQRYVPAAIMAALSGDEKIKNHMKSPEQGAATTIWAAVGKELEGKGGQYLENCGAGQLVKESYEMLHTGYGPMAFNQENEEKLWAESLKMVGL
ncbi:MAG: hypothetical protein M1834_002468 [Cirrosporium novae-zelandiae]|nr:MAG: hypothetical protein M1834_002468 [Cirrosporium novae-zelandiae]